MLLILPARKQRLAAAVWCALGLAALWGPFVAFGEFSMHEYRWRIRPGSVLVPLLGSPAPFPWPLRLL